MSRDVTTTFEDNVNNDVIKPFFAIEMLFDGDQTLRLWTGMGTLEYQGNEWYGTGNLLAFDTVTETADMSAEGATVTLSGVPNEVLSLALTEPYQGRRAYIYFGLHLDGEVVAITSPEGELFLNNEGEALVGYYGPDDTESMVEIFAGFMDQMNIQEGADASTVELTIENQMMRLEDNSKARYTSAYQKSIYPNDKGLDFLEWLEDADITWGYGNGSDSGNSGFGKFYNGNVNDLFK